MTQIDLSRSGKRRTLLHSKNTRLKVGNTEKTITIILYMWCSFSLPNYQSVMGCLQNNRLLEDLHCKESFQTESTTSDPCETLCSTAACLLPTCVKPTSRGRNICKKDLNMPDDCVLTKITVQFVNALWQKTKH